MRVYVMRRGLKTGLVSSGSKLEQIDRNKVLLYSKWSAWPPIQSDLNIKMTINGSNGLLNAIIKLLGL